MSETEPPKMSTVEQPKRDFKVVTTTKNRLVKAIKACDDDEIIVDYIQKELPGAIDEFVSIIMELAGLDEKIQTNKHFEFLKKLDFQSMVMADRLLDTQVKETRVFSLLDEIQRSNASLGEVKTCFISDNSCKYKF